MLATASPLLRGRPRDRRVGAVNQIAKRDERRPAASSCPPRTLIIRRHADRRPRLPRRRPAQGNRARRAARLPSDPDLQSVATHVETDDLPRGGRRGLPPGDGRQPDRRRADPRRLPAQLRIRGPRHPRQVAGFADPLPARRRRDWRARRRPAPRLGQDRATSARRSSGPAQSIAGRSPRASAASCTWRTRPAPAARSGAPSRSSPR